MLNFWLNKKGSIMFEKNQQILDVSADLMGNRIRREEKVGWLQKRRRIRNQEGFEDGWVPAIGGRGRRRGASRGWN